MKKRQAEYTRLPFPFPVGSGITNTHQFQEVNVK
ncbi:Uncharacterized protein BCRIVMBC126_00915 [Bacillus wiedmannii]|nr:Uncharacterized protein BCRIVMBC126_00915 [Bacillus wiedmannii]